MPDDEPERLAALHRYDVAWLSDEPALDTLTALVSRLLNTPISLLTLIDADRQLVPSAHGAGDLLARDPAGRVTPMARDLAFCSHTILSDEILVVKDARRDQRFAQNPIVLQNPGIRFYAGAPLITQSGHRIGALCAIDSRPRQLTANELAVLRSLANLARDQLELRYVTRRLQEELAEKRRIEQIKDEFVSTVSHELRTPLTSIRGSLGLIAAGAVGSLPDRAREMIEIAQRNSERLSLLIDDVLDIEKVQSSQFTLRPEAASAQELFRLAIDATQGFARQRAVTFALLHPDAPLLLVADKARIVQVLVNLMSNAVKFSAPGDEIRLEATSLGGAARFIVEDRGPGIPAEFRSRIFRRFAQADSSDARRAGGTGLGLSIARAIVDHHGGTIDFASPAEGDRGTRFWVDLPLRAVPAGPGGLVACEGGA